MWLSPSRNRRCALCVAESSRNRRCALCVAESSCPILQASAVMFSDHRRNVIALLGVCVCVCVCVCVHKLFVLIPLCDLLHNFQYNGQHFYEFQILRTHMYTAQTLHTQLCTLCTDTLDRHCTENHSVASL